MRENPFRGFESVKNKIEVKSGVGEKICDVELEYASVESDLGFGFNARRMIRIVLEKDMPEGPKRIDLLARLKTQLPEDLKLFEADLGKRQGFFNLYDNWILAPKPSDSAAIGTLLHELGHASQSMEKRYRDMLKVGDVALSSTILWNSNWQKDLQEMKPAFTEAEWEEVQAFEKQLIPLMAEKREFSERERVLNEGLKSAKLDEEPQPEILDIIDKLSDIDSKIVEITNGRFNDLVDRPIKATERDATRRAFEWMRSLKKEGFDFLGKITGPDNMPEMPSVCRPKTSSQRKGDAFQELKKGLATYRAARPLKK